MECGSTALWYAVRAVLAMRRFQFDGKRRQRVRQARRQSVSRRNEALKPRPMLVGTYPGNENHH
jgi:hypothetical protein